MHWLLILLNTIRRRKHRYKLITLTNKWFVSLMRNVYRLNGLPLSLIHILN